MHDRGFKRRDNTCGPVHVSCTLQSETHDLSAFSRLLRRSSSRSAEAGDAPAGELEEDAGVGALPSESMPRSFAWCPGCCCWGACWGGCWEAGCCARKGACPNGAMTGNADTDG
jgi:hypothetical protein